MALDPCNPCGCDPAQLMLEPQSAKITIARILCEILGALDGGSSVPDTITSDRKLNAAAATPETLVGVSTPCSRVDIMALPTNTNPVYIGGSTVEATGTVNGIRLMPGDKYLLDIDDVQKVYLDVVTDGEGVTFNYFT